MIEGKPILVGVTGGIAAYKICEVVSSLAKRGAEVRVILTDRSTQFVSPLTFATLSRHPAYLDRDFWQPSQGRPLHIELGEWAAAMLIAPLSAHTLAKLTYGLADNLLTNTVLASTCPILLAPAMNTDMWQQPTVQHNWRQLLSDPRYHSIDPGEGLLACDRVGQGRLAEPPQILAALESLLHSQGRRDLVGRSILISAGGTREHWDSVRYLGNPSTGKMGVALALAAQHRGAQVTLVHAPLSPELLEPLSGMRLVPIVSAAEMQQALKTEFEQTDWLLMAAAVADVRPAEVYAGKLPKRSLPDALALEPVPDLVAELGRQKQPRQRILGFAAQTGEIVPPAREKLRQKQLDAIVANPIDQPDSGFGSDRNQAVILSETQTQPIDPCSKLEMAHQIYDFLVRHW